MVTIASGDILIPAALFASPFTSTIQVWRAGALADTFTGPANTLYGDAFGIGLDASFNIFVCSRSNGGSNVPGVYKHAADGTSLGIFGGPYVDPYDVEPCAASCDSAGNVYVLSFTGNSSPIAANGDYPLLRKFNSTGTLITTYDITVNEGGRGRQPTATGLWVNPDGSEAYLAIMDNIGAANSRSFIEHLDLGSLVQTNIVNQPQSDELVPFGIAVAGGKIYASDSGTPDFYIRRWNEDGSGEEDFANSGSFIQDVAISVDGLSAHAVDRGNGRIYTTVLSTGNTSFIAGPDTSLVSVSDLAVVCGAEGISCTAAANRGARSWAHMVASFLV